MHAKRCKPSTGRQTELNVTELNDMPHSGLTKLQSTIPVLFSPTDGSQVNYNNKPCKFAVALHVFDSVVMCDQWKANFRMFSGLRTVGIRAKQANSRYSFQNMSRFAA
jgi:hypothetical protein